MAAVLIGRRSWSLSRDKDGHRDYLLKMLVKTTDIDDGPGAVLLTPGLPLPGSFWAYGNDVDPWATCRWDAKVSVHQEKEGDPNKHWIVEIPFSTKPVDTKACRDYQFQDPLLEPQKISGGTKFFSEEVAIDRFGQPVVNSAWEFFKGPNVEFEDSNLTLSIEQNVADLQRSLLAQMIQTVNDRTIWGYARRTVALSDISWERKYYGNCYVYYTRKLMFTIRHKGWDRDILDEGTKALQGKWDKTTGNWILEQINGRDPDPFNPQHFRKFIDRQGNPAKVVLNGRGLPAGIMVGPSTNSGEFFASLTDANVGNPLSDATNWIALVDLSDVSELGLVDVPVPTAWVAGGAYPRGKLVTYSGDTWVAVAYPVTEATPSIDLEPGKSDWKKLGTAVASLTSQGDYDDATSYDKLDYVRDSNLVTRPGYIHVEKDRESNFLLLGVPVII